MKATCQCGLSSFELAAPPKRLFVCNCLSCRAQSSSAFGLSLLYAVEDVPELPKTLKKWDRPTDSGNIISGYFCGQCGSRMAHVNTRGHISVKGGVIRGTENFEWEKATHLFTRTKLPWIIIPAEAEQYEADIINQWGEIIINKIKHWILIHDNVCRLYLRPFIKSFLPIFNSDSTLFLFTKRHCHWESGSSSINGNSSTF